MKTIPLLLKRMFQLDEMLFISGKNCNKRKPIIHNFKELKVQTLDHGLKIHDFWRVFKIKKDLYHVKELFKMNKKVYYIKVPTFLDQKIMAESQITRGYKRNVSPKSRSRYITCMSVSSKFTVTFSSLILLKKSTMDA